MWLSSHGDILPSASPALESLDLVRGIDAIIEGHSNESHDKADQWHRETSDQVDQRVVAELASKVSLCEG